MDTAITVDQFVVECLLKRDGGTIVQIGDKSYHFRPTAEGKHLAVIEDVDHLAAFSSIPEAYAILGRIPPHNSVSPDALAAAAGIPASAPVPIVAAEPDKEGDATEGDSENDEEGQTDLAAHIDTLAGAAGDQADQGQDEGQTEPAQSQQDAADATQGAAEEFPADDAALRKLFEATVGRKAGSRTSRDVMIDQIKAARAAS